MKKQMEGDNRQRRHKARSARQRGHRPSAEAVTTGGSDQRFRLRTKASHTARLLARLRGKQDPPHHRGRPRPGSR